MMPAMRETLLKHADEAMYSAKHQGRNNFQIYEVSPEYARNTAWR